MKSIASTLLLLSLLGLFCASSLAAPLGDSQPDQTENIDQLIEETKQLAREAGTASYVIYTYIVSINRPFSTTLSYITFNFLTTEK